MRFLLGLVIGMASLVSITALIFAETQWLIEPGASYTIEDVKSLKGVKVKSAGEDEESASLHCKTEGAVRLLEYQYKNYGCKPCADSSISIKNFQINYPNEAEIIEITEHKIGGITVFVASCDVTEVSGTLSCSACPETVE